MPPAADSNALDELLRQLCSPQLSDVAMLEMITDHLCSNTIPEFQMQTSSNGDCDAIVFCAPQF